MKIEVIEKKREDAKETPFVVGGVYSCFDGSVYVLTKVDGEAFAFTWLGATSDGWADSQPDTYLHDRSGIRGFLDEYTYVPNARLIIDENEGEAN